MHKLHALTTLSVSGLAAATAVNAQESKPAQVDSLDRTVVIAEDPRVEVKPSSNSKLLTDIDKTPRSIEIVTRKQIEERGAQSVAEAVRYTTGVFSEQFGLDSRRDAISIRGIDPLLMRDGFRYNVGFDNTVRPDAFTLESVEVVKGPASVLGGQGAVGGTVNSVSKVAKQGDFAQLKLEYGSYNRKQIGVDVNGAMDDSDTIFFRAVALWRDSDTQVDHVKNNAYLFSPSITWVPSEDTTLTVLANFQNNKGGFTSQFMPYTDAFAAANGVAINPSSSTFVGEPDYDRYDANERSLTVNFDHKINDKFSVTANVKRAKGESQQNYMQVISPNAARAFNLDATGGLFDAFPISPIVNGNEFNRIGYAREQSLSTWAANSFLRADLETGALKHNAQFGFDFLEANRESWRGTDPALGTTGFFLPDGFTGPFPNSSQAPININDPQYGTTITAPTLDTLFDTRLSQFGLVFGDVITYNDLVVSLGVRHDWVEEIVHYRPEVNSKINKFSYDFGLLYQFENGISPYYSYAESFTPNGVDAVTGDPLAPLTGKQHEVGVKYIPGAGNTLFTASAFKIDQDNVIQFPLNSLLGSGSEQISVETKGLEFDVKHRVHDFFFQGGLTLLDATNKSSAANLKAAQVPEQIATAWATYAPQSGKLDGFRSGLGLRYIGRSYSRDNTVSSDDPTLLDAMLGYTWKDIDFQLSISNLLDKEYIAYVEKQDPADYTVGAFGARRNIVLSATYTF